jgi:mono/diheme cytochrome c family protein
MPRRWGYWLVTLLMPAVGASPALAQHRPADLARGQELAAHLCSLCHDVTRDQSDSTENQVPSFVTIASKPHQSAVSLAEAIIFPHPDMPRTSFTTKDLSDIIAYIMSLKATD